MHIYRAGRKIVSKEFQNKFWISKEITGDELFWEADEEQHLPKGGIFQIWILGASSTPMIAFVAPDWQVIIDGVALEQGPYDDHIGINGKTVELRHNDYRFVCSFPTIEGKSAVKVLKVAASSQ
jgi:hypothetical protein